MIKQCIASTALLFTSCHAFQVSPSCASSSRVLIPRTVPSTKKILFQESPPLTALRQSMMPQEDGDDADIELHAAEIVEDDNYFEEPGTVNLSMTLLILLKALNDSTWVYATTAKGFAF